MRAADRVMALDAVPAMSGNVWHIITTSFRACGPPCRVLEWGSGNSTLGIIQAGLDAKKAFSLVSIEHDELCYDRVVEAVVALVTDRRPDVRRETGPLSDEGRLPPLRELLRNVRGLENAANILYAAADDWNIKRSRGYASGAPLRVWRLSARLARAWVQWKVAQAGLVAASALEGLARQPRRRARVMSLTGGDFAVFLLLVPPEASLLGPTCTYDGLAAEFYRYVTVKLPHARYDIILVDGRARASCLKRVFSESLSALDGVVYCHDAYRQAYWSAFELFSDFVLVPGDGVRLDGRTVMRRTGYPAVKQRTEPTAASPMIANELFVYPAAGAVRREDQRAAACGAAR
ncbi:MAG: hypothetical protein ACE5JR_13030 [Gemmatimonadota bacterium]